MDAVHIVARLLEAPDDPDGPEAIGPIPDYVAPVAMKDNLKDILEHAMLLKEQAEQAGALGMLQNAINTATKHPRFNLRDIDRAFLLIAVRHILENEEHMPQTIAKILEREMHFVWS